MTYTYGSWTLLHPHAKNPTSWSTKSHRLEKEGRQGGRVWNNPWSSGGIAPTKSHRLELAMRRRKREADRETCESLNLCLFLFSRLALSINLKRYLSWAPRLVLTTRRRRGRGGRSRHRSSSDPSSLPWIEYLSLRLPPVLFLLLVAMQVREVVVSSGIRSSTCPSLRTSSPVHCCSPAPAPAAEVSPSSSSCWLHDYFTISVQVMRCVCSVFSCVHACKACKQVVGTPGPGLTCYRTQGE